MANILYKIGTFMAKHKWWGSAIWLIILLAVLVPMILTNPKFDNDLTMNGLKSVDTNDKIQKHFDQDSEKAQIRLVIKSDADDGIVKNDLSKDLQRTLKDIKDNDSNVDTVSNPYKSKQISKDKTTAIADVNYDISSTALSADSRDKVKDEAKDLEDKHNVQVELTGNGMSTPEMGMTSETVGIIVAFIVLLITFGSFIAAGLPIVSALIGLGTSISIISLLTFVFDVPSVTVTLAVMIGLALSIDYALFILSRFKEIKSEETDPIKAIGLATGTAGSAVVFAGVTVLIAVLGLSILGIDFLTTTGIAAAISVIFAVLTALTLVPVLVGIFHKHIKPKKQNIREKKNADTKWSKFVIGMPTLAIIIALIILVIAILPVKDMRLGIPDDGMSPDDTTQKKAYNIISDKFGEGYNGQIAMLVNVKDKKDNPQILQKDLQSMQDDIKDIKNVDSVLPPQMNDNNDYALVIIIPEKGPNAESTNDLVHDLRDYNDTAKGDYEFKTEVSSQSVINIDMTDKINESIPLFASVIVLLAFVLLMIVFRSIIVPLKAVLGFVLSLLASLGITTLVMQDGVLSGLFGIDTPGPLFAMLPVIVISLLFGLAMDYEVFLMSRIHEEYRKTYNTNLAVKLGIKKSGPVIVAAALIMFSVFFAFVFQDDTMVKSMGLALGVGVLFDAFIVRLTLIPALTTLFGKASWYIPSWLNKIIPNVDIEGESLQSNMHKQAATEHYDQFFSVDQSTQNHDSSLKSNTIHVDSETKNLYNEINHQTSNHKVLYNALINYQEQFINNGKSQQYENISKNQYSNTEILRILNQQSKNIESINKILEEIMNQRHE
ncbi:MMPL family transporter [Mammaliicoccus sciuri]|uniref:MMPL family transporter n=1 Tax=Mammaliicoccus sciuri TaxID=1296 RepID=UPI003792AF40